jgi:hypothetical protein
MNIDYFNEFLRYEHNGIKAKAKECINKFIKSFENYREKELWAIEYLPRLEKNSNGRIRNELFEEILFPVLLNGYKNKNIELMIWLIKLNQNYYQNKRIWEQLNYKTTLEIVTECYDMEPNNEDVQDIYLEIKIEKMNYRIHEWPPYILFGNSVATQEECRKLLEEIPFIKRLDRNNKYWEYITEYEEIIKEYIEIKK